MGRCQRDHKLITFKGGACPACSLVGEVADLKMDVAFLEHRIASLTDNEEEHKIEMDSVILDDSSVEDTIVSNFVTRVKQRFTK